MARTAKTQSTHPEVSSPKRTAARSLGKKPDQQALFSRMGKVYKLLVNERLRRRREEPLLLEMAERAGMADAPRKTGAPRPKPRAATLVLDLGCGTGFHSRLLARAGYPVLAIDASPSMLRTARRFKAAGSIVYKRGDLLAPLPVEQPASLTLLLGNTLSVFETPRDLRRALGHAAAATRSGGLVLCQVLNYERLRRLDTVATVRHGRVDGRETVLTKVLQVVEDGRVLLSLTACRRGRSGGWESFGEVSTLTPVEPRALQTAARRAGLRPEAVWGSHAKEPFDPAASVDYIALFRKP